MILGPPVQVGTLITNLIFITTKKEYHNNYKCTLGKQP